MGWRAVGWLGSGVWRRHVLVLGLLGLVALVEPWIPLPPQSAPQPAPTLATLPIKIQDLPSEAPHATATAVPTGVQVARIGVNAPVVQLSLNADGSVPTPSDPGSVGWVTASPLPGALGPAVLVGHLDSYTGPAVFWRLSELRPGDLIKIRRADGTSVDFAVSRVARYRADAFPNAEVYGATPTPELRLITCTGSWDWGKRQYQDRTVVYATLAP